MNFEIWDIKLFQRTCRNKHSFDYVMSMNKLSTIIITLHYILGLHNLQYYERKKTKKHENWSELVSLFFLHVFCAHVCVTLFPLGFANGSINMCSCGVNNIENKFIKYKMNLDNKRKGFTHKWDLTLKFWAN